MCPVQIWTCDLVSTDMLCSYYARHGCCVLSSACTMIMTLLSASERGHNAMIKSCTAPLHTISLSAMHQYGRTSVKNMNNKKITCEMMKSDFAMATGETPAAANLRTSAYSSMCLDSAPDYGSGQCFISLHGDAIVKHNQWFAHDVRKNQWQGWGSWRQFIRIKNASI